jgi:hypothetical protein
LQKKTKENVLDIKIDTHVHTVSSGHAYSTLNDYIKIAKIKGIRIYEVGISYYGRTFEEGKKIGWKDAFRAMYCIIKYKFN